MIQRVLFLLLFPFALQASHIIGGNFEIVQTGPNDYHVTLVVFRDCGSPGSNPVQLQKSIYVGIFDPITKIQLGNVWLFKTDSMYVSLGDSCYKPTGLCVQEIRMTNTMSLANNSNGYTFAAQICCRNYAIDNIVFPGNTGITWTIDIPDAQTTFGNSSPDLGAYPSLGYLCLNNFKTLDLAATDLDGDSLGYQLAPPLNNKSLPENPPLPPPYPEVNWKPGYSFLNPINGNPPLSINNQTGLLTCAADELGVFVFAYEVIEYRNGVRIGAVRRDLQIQVLPCIVDQPPIFLSPTDSVYAFEGGIDKCIQILVVDSNLSDSIILISRFDSSKVSPASWASLSINNIGVGYNSYSLCWSPTCSESVSGTSFLLELRAYSEGCSGSKDAIKTLYFELPSILDSLQKGLPNVFTPNGDGLNDLYKFQEPLNHACMGQIQMKIFNRWGRMIYENPLPEVEWDGTDNGRSLADGVYFYAIEGYLDSIPISRKGTITIMR